MAACYLGLSGSVLNFAGGAFLVYDSLRARKKTLAHFGRRKLAESNAKSSGGSPLYETPDGKPLATELDWELWHTELALKWTWVGFLLISAGFLLDIIGRLVCPAS